MGLEAWQVAVYRRLPRVLKMRAVRLATPNFTVGALGLITDDGSRLLLVRPTYRNGWLPPGGFLNRGELPVQALEREVREELGLQVEFAEPHRVHVDVGRQGVTFVSVGRVPPGTEPSVRSPELSRVGWFRLDDLPQLPNDFHEGLPAEDLEAVRRAGRRSGEGTAPGGTRAGSREGASERADPAPIPPKERDMSDGNDTTGDVKDALKNDWEQTKSDLPGVEGKDMDQDVDDTVKQAAGKEPTDGTEN